MRKKLYANASPSGRDIAIKELNKAIPELKELYNPEPYIEYKYNSLRAINEQSIVKHSNNEHSAREAVIRNMLRKMSPAYKRGKAESIADPLAHRLGKVMRILRKRLSHQDFLEAARHVDNLSPIEQAGFCEGVEKWATEERKRRGG